jgi:hypothetical protein
MQCWVGQEGELDKRGLSDFRDNLSACAFTSLHDVQLYLQGVETSRELVEAAVMQVKEETKKPIHLHYL